MPGPGCLGVTAGDLCAGPVEPGFPGGPGCLEVIAGDLWTGPVGPGMPGTGCLGVIVGTTGGILGGCCCGGAPGLWSIEARIGPPVG